MRSGFRHKQSGMTALGILFLLVVFGILGLAGLKAVPLYIKKMRVESVMEDLERDLPGQTLNSARIRTELSNRLYIEGIQIPREDVSIRQIRNGFQVHVLHETRAEFLADLWLMVIVDEQVDIIR